MSLRDRILSPGPKKLLAIDGGGIRGVLAPRGEHRNRGSVARWIVNPGYRRLGHCVAW
jgi:uncharacterized protein